MTSPVRESRGHKSTLGNQAVSARVARGHSDHVDGDLQLIAHEAEHAPERPTAPPIGAMLPSARRAIPLWAWVLIAISVAGSSRAKSTIAPAVKEPRNTTGGPLIPPVSTVENRVDRPVRMRRAFDVECAGDGCDPGTTARYRGPGRRRPLCSRLGRAGPRYSTRTSTAAFSNERPPTTGADDDTTTARRARRACVPGNRDGEHRAPCASLLVDRERRRPFDVRADRVTP